MTIRYELISSPSSDFRFDTSSKKDATEFLAWYLEAMPLRMHRLWAIVNNGDERVKEEYSRESLSTLSTWFKNIIAANMPTNCENANLFITSSPLCVSLCADCGYYLAETLRRNSKSLYWSIIEGRKDLVGYHMPAVHGFGKGMTFEPLRMTGVFAVKAATQILSGSTQSARLSELYDTWRALVL